MSNTNTGGPAFPGFDYIDQHGKKNPEGMTLRDYFAAKALQGWHANPDNVPTPEGWVAKWAYQEADAMLKARDA
jgi:hypothetical protein